MPVGLALRSAIQWIINWLARYATEKGKWRIEKMSLYELPPVHFAGSL